MIICVGFIIVVYSYTTYWQKCTIRILFSRKFPISVYIFFVKLCLNKAGPCIPVLLWVPNFKQLNYNIWVGLGLPFSIKLPLPTSPIYFVFYVYLTTQFYPWTYWRVFAEIIDFGWTSCRLDLSIWKFPRKSTAYNLYFYLPKFFSL